MKTRYCVTRQIQFPGSDCVVEISIGGTDYTNPGVFGDINEFETATEAVEFAIVDAEEWSGKETKDGVTIGYGATGGWTLPFSGHPLCEETYSALRQWAETADEALPRCEHCSDILGDKTWLAYGLDDQSFCSEHCADMAAQHEQAFAAELAEEAGKKFIYELGVLLAKYDAELRFSGEDGGFDQALTISVQDNDVFTSYHGTLSSFDFT
jgi:hypothetical protein